MSVTSLQPPSLPQPGSRPWIEGRFEENMVLTTVEQAINWARQSSIWPMTFGLACCAIEMMAAGASRYDLDRFGAGAFRATPRQADLMIVAGTVTYKMASRVRRLYNLMPDPKYVIAMGACTTGGGPYFKWGYHVVKGVDLVAAPLRLRHLRRHRRRRTRIRPSENHRLTSQPSDNQFTAADRRPPPDG